jgi:hypothetical protein
MQKRNETRDILVFEFELFIGERYRLVIGREVLILYLQHCPHACTRYQIF